MPSFKSALIPGSNDPTNKLIVLMTDGALIVVSSPPV